MLRFTQWYNRNEQQDPSLSNGDIMWGLCCDANSFDPIVIPPGFAWYDTVLDNAYSWVIDEHDQFTIVPIEEWPDEVCAAMAQRVLAP